MTTKSFADSLVIISNRSVTKCLPFTLDLTFATNALANRIYLPIPLLIVAAFWYLVITSILMVGQHFIEAHYGKGVDNRVPAAINPAAAKASAAPGKAPARWRFSAWKERCVSTSASTAASESSP